MAGDILDLIIDTPVDEYSSEEELIYWLERLNSLDPKTDEVLTEIAFIEGLLGE